MKKIIGVVLIGLICLNIVACGNGNASKDDNQVVIPEGFTEGYEEASFSNFNSYASSKDLIDTPIWIQGEMGEIDTMPLEEGEGNVFISFVNSEEGKWLVFLESDLFKERETFEELTGKDVLLCCVFYGYAFEYEAPAVYAIKLCDLDSGNEIKSTFGILVRNSSEQDTTASEEISSNEEEQSTEEETDPTEESKVSFVIKNGVRGEYGFEKTLNAGTEFEETQIVYHIPAGTYLVKNTGQYSGQIEACSDATYINEDGWEEPYDVKNIVVLESNRTAEFSIEDGYYLETHVEGDLVFVLK